MSGPNSRRTDVTTTMRLRREIAKPDFRFASLHTGHSRASPE